MQRSQGPWNSDSFLPGEQIKKNWNGDSVLALRPCPLRFLFSLGSHSGGGISSKRKKPKKNKKSQAMQGLGLELRVKGLVHHIVQGTRGC